MKTPLQLQDFDAQDREAYCGAEGDNPKIAYFGTRVLIVDDYGIHILNTPSEESGRHTTMANIDCSFTDGCLMVTESSERFWSLYPLEPI